MAKYVSLYRYTGEIKGGGPERFKSAQAIVAAENCEIVSVYGLLGEYDIVTVVECPDNRAAMTFSGYSPNSELLARAARRRCGGHSSPRNGGPWSMASGGKSSRHTWIVMIQSASAARSIETGSVSADPMLRPASSSTYRVANSTTTFFLQTPLVHASSMRRSHTAGDSCSGPSWFDHVPIAESS